MNNQSDYGYTIPEIEHRTPELCERRSKFCADMAAANADDPVLAAKYRQWSHEWMIEREAILRGHY